MNKEEFVNGLKYTEEERLARDVRKMLDELSQQWDAQVQVEDLNLEEIFVELHDV